MKQPLPAKYSKMTVCSFWILKQLKTMGMLTEEQMKEAAEEFNLTKDNEDQMHYFKDLVENFKDHEGYLKMYANASKLVEDVVEVVQVEKVPVEKVPTEFVSKKKKELTQTELIRRLLEKADTSDSDASDSDTSDSDTSDSDTSDSDTSSSVRETDKIISSQPKIMPKKIKLVIKK